MDVILFFIRHTPFWAVPLLLIGADFAYLYWLKSFKKVALVFAAISFFSLISLCYYFIAGGPHKAPQAFYQFFQ